MENNNNNAFDGAGFLEAAGRLKTKYLSGEVLGLSPGAKGVWIRELTGAERERALKMGGTMRMLPGDVQEFDLSTMSLGAMSQLVLWALVTDSKASKQLFTDRELSRIKKLSGSVLEVIAKEVRILSGMTEESEAAKKKHLETTPVNGSGIP